MSILGYKLVYNNVPLDVTNGSQILREHVYSPDGTTYHFTRWIFDGIFIYNPLANSFGPGGNPGVGVLPTPSDVNVRELLRSQRRRLTYSIPNGQTSGGSLGYDILLDTPGAVPNSNPPIRFPTDANNGPKVERCNIVQTQGVKTFVCDIRIVACVNECTSSNRSPLLSHRWKRTERVDQDFYSTIITEGECVFRSDELQAFSFPTGNPLGLGWPGFPDQFRKDLFHPIPNTFQREDISVVAQEDGVTYSYQIVDKQKACGGPWSRTGSRLYGNLGVTRIEAFHTSFYSQESLAANADIIAIEAARGAVTGSPTVIGSGAGGLAGTALGTLMATIQSLPKYKNHIVARAWGDALVAPNRLQGMAVGAVLGVADQLTDVPNAIGASTEFIVMHNLTENFVQAEITISTGFTSKLFKGQLEGAIIFANGISNVQSNFLYRWTKKGTVSHAFAAGETFNQPATVFPITGLRDSVNLEARPAPSGDNVSRGTWMGNIIAQALTGRCVTPPKPPKLSIKVPSGATAGGAFGLNPAEEVVYVQKLV